ncbi:MAG: prephenate dehydrogenase [Eubacterium sp.]|jgi:prephenate dehydrogenase|nr:prephenate dehydrogenase [Eubacterium sp.]
MRILIAGLGLIGGSVCKALKKYTDHEVGGFDLNSNILKRAKKETTIDKAVYEKSKFIEYDCFILCINPLFVDGFMRDCDGCFSEKTIIADVCGVKNDLPQTMTEFCASRGLHYVSTHPMAGKERSGYENSSADLFLNANFIVTPVSDTDLNAMETVERIACEIGFKNFIRISPSEHDSVIAYTSQLAHVVSGAYVKSPMMEKEKGFTGGSFQDMTRIATMDEDLWSALFLLNKDKLISEIDILLENISLYKKALGESNELELKRLICESRVLKEKDLSNTKFLTRFD